HSALLLIKPARTSARQRLPIVAQPYLAELRQLRAFINGSINGIDASELYPRSEYVDLHSGMVKQRSESGSMLHVRRDIQSGRISRYRIWSDERWEILEDIPFRWAD